MSAFSKSLSWLGTTFSTSLAFSWPPMIMTSSHSKRTLFKRAGPSATTSSAFSRVRQNFVSLDTFQSPFFPNFADCFVTSIFDEENEKEIETSDSSCPTVDSLMSFVSEALKLEYDNKFSNSSVKMTRVVCQICDGYKTLSLTNKNKFIIALASNYSVDPSAVKSKAAEISALKAEDLMNEPRFLRLSESLKACLEPPYKKLFTRIGQLKDGVLFLVNFRAQVICVRKEDASSCDIKAMDSTLKSLLSAWFSVGFLHLERVTWSSPCELLQKVSEYEAVHPIRNWTDLKSRVGSYRRCYIYTHHSMPGEPIVVLHAALTQEIASSIDTLVKYRQKLKRHDTVDTDLDFDEDKSTCTAAVFYSITSTQIGLQGIELGTLLIKQAVERLKGEFPRMGRLATLSPIPGFRTWLLLQLQRGDGGDILTKEEQNRLTPLLESFCNYSVSCEEGSFRDALAKTLKSNRWLQDDNLKMALETPLMRSCARYLYLEKWRNFALDSVANFHLRNGATLWRLNWLADVSPRGLTQSCGLMVNYRYFTDNLEENSSIYQEKHIISAGEQVLQLVAEAQRVAGGTV